MQRVENFSRDHRLFAAVPPQYSAAYPPGLFLGILLVFGRMYVENEITAMHTAGIGVVKLLLLTSLAVVPVAVITGWLALYVSPEGFQRAEQLLNGEKKRSNLDLVEPGKFLDCAHGAVFCIRAISAMIAK